MLANEFLITEAKFIATRKHKYYNGPTINCTSKRSPKQRPDIDKILHCENCNTIDITLDLHGKLDITLLSYSV